MAYSSSQNNHNAFDLNDVPRAQPEVWHPYFLALNGPINVSNFVMLSVTIATAVTVGLSTPKDGSVLAKRIDSQAINNSMALTIQCAASVSNMGRCLHVRNHEV
jgi:hypothetical protein